MLKRTLSILLLAQMVFCAISLGFTPAVLVAFALMIAAPFCFISSMTARGFAFLLLPCIVGALVLQQAILSPVFLGWLALVVVVSLVCWNRGPDKPPFSSTDAI